MSASRRIESLDVARGAAMLFVCLSHFADSYLDPWRWNAPLGSRVEWWGRVATMVSMIATPCFMTLSGVLAGYLGQVTPEKLPALRRKLIDRGLFLLLIGHLIQAPAYAELSNLRSSLRFLYITDTIGAAIIIGPSLVLWTGRRFRLLAGALLLVITWAASTWSPDSMLAATINRYALGGSITGKFVAFPLLPWLAVYLFGTAMGEHIALSGRTFGERAAERFFFRIGLALSSAGLVAVMLRNAYRALVPSFMTRHVELNAFLGPLRKLPVGPLYLAIFGGGGLILIGLAFACSRSSGLATLLKPVATLGRASFFIFCLQAYVYQILLPAAHLPYPALWPAYYAVSVVILLLAAAFWDRFDANRYLTVGLWRAVRFLRGLRARIQAAPVLR